MAAGYDVIVIGAGVSGMYQLHRLCGLGLRVRVFEAGDGVGGTSPVLVRPQTVVREKGCSRAPHNGPDRFPASTRRDRNEHEDVLTVCGSHGGRRARFWECNRARFALEPAAGA